jgi:hypothetical protein
MTLPEESENVETDYELQYKSVKESAALLP